MSQVNARILLWGLDGAGKTTTLETIHSKLRPDLRGELRREATRLDPTVFYETLPITLGEVAGVPMQIEIVSVPGAPDQAMTRKQLLDEVDGIILLMDASPERIHDNEATVAELKTSLAAYGHRLDAFPVVLQYNKRDIADPFAIEDLHRRIGLSQAAVFETIATTGHGVLPTLTTISKHVVRARRGSSPSQLQATPLAVQPEQDSAAEPEALVQAAPVIEAIALDEDTHDLLEAAILAEADGDDFDDIAEAVEIDLSSTGTQPDWNAVSAEMGKPDATLGAELRIVSVGQAAIEADGGVRLPLVLGDEDGQTRSVLLSLRIESLVGDGGD